MAVALVNQQGSSSATSVASFGLTLGAAPTNGNMLVLGCECNDDATGPSVATTGVVWTRQQYLVGDAAHDNFAYWTGVVGASAAALTTVTMHASCNYAAILGEFSGVQQVIDGTTPAVSSQTSGTVTTPSMTPTVTGDLAVAFVGSGGTLHPQAVTTAPATWNIFTRQVAGTTIGIDAAWKEISGTSATSAVWVYAAATDSLSDIVLIKGTAVASAFVRPKVVVSREAHRRSSRW